MLLVAGVLLVGAATFAEAGGGGGWKNVPPRKHVCFMTSVGTPSHFVAMGEIGRVMRERGHLFSWGGFDDAHKLWDRERLDFPFVRLGAEGDSFQAEQMLRRHNTSLTHQRPGVLSLGRLFSQVMPDKYKSQFKPTQDFMTQGGVARYLDGSEEMLPRPDLVVCDNAAFACVDLAYSLKVPYVIATHGFFFNVGRVPYLMDGSEGDPEVSFSLPRRVWNMLLPWVAIYAFYPMMTAMQRYRDEVGAPKLWGPSFLRWRGVSVLNTGSFFGWDEARELGPHVHMVGPIIDPRVRDPPPLPRHLQAQLTSERAERLLQALRALTTTTTKGGGGTSGGVVSGAIVANKAPCPWTDTQLAHANIRWEPWVPQTSVLAHPATRAFITHGGQESVVEAVYHGVPLLVFPNFGDQFVNGHKARAAGVGDWVNKDTATAETIAEKLSALVVDEDGSVRESVERLRVLMHYASKDKANRAADVIETELLVGNRHLLTLPERVGNFRAYNFDIYLSAAALVIVLLLGLGRLCCGRGPRKAKAKAEKQA